MKTDIGKSRQRFLSASSCLLAGGLFAIIAFSAPPPSSGEETFKAKCAMCHGADGSGNTPMGKRAKLRDLRSPEVQKQTDDELAGIISNGRPPMPAYGKTLSSGEIRQLVAYLRRIANRS